MDVALLKKLMGNNPMFREKCFIISLSQADEEAKVARAICQEFGQDNIQAVEFLTDKVILVTLNDSSTRNHLLATTCVKNYVRDPTRSGEEPAATWIHPLAPVPASVEATVSGIPYVVATTNMASLVEEVCEALPSISEVRFECSKWSDSFLNNGTMVMRFVTSDLADIMQKLSGKGKIITFFGFHGRIVYKEATPYMARERMSSLAAEKVECALA